MRSEINRVTIRFIKDGRKISSLVRLVVLETEVDGGDTTSNLYFHDNCDKLDRKSAAEVFKRNLTTADCYDLEAITFQDFSIADTGSDNVNDKANLGSLGGSNGAKLLFYANQDAKAELLAQNMVRILTTIQYTKPPFRNTHVSRGSNCTHRFSPPPSF